MGYKKTNPSEGIMSWAKDVRNKLRPNERRGLLRKKEDEGEDKKKNETDVRNN